MKKITILLAFLLLTSVFNTVAADDCTHGPYESCPSHEGIAIHKEVGRPLTKNYDCSDFDTIKYQDNIYDNDYRFNANSVICFRLTVKNTSDHDLEIDTRDVMPDYLTKTNKDMAVNKSTYRAGEEKIFIIKSNVVDANRLSVLSPDQSLLCLTNIGKVKSNNASDQSTSQFCIGKTVTGVTKVPSAGPEMGLALFAGESALLGLGLFLKKRLS